MKSIVIDRDRAVLAKATEDIKKFYKAGAAPILTPGFMRIEALISNGKQTYDFRIQRDNTADTVTERKVDRKDMFVMSEMGLYLMKRVSTLTGGEKLQTYVNEVEFADNSTTFIGDHLNAFFNGSVKIQVGQTVLAEAIDTKRFKVVPDTQAAAAAYAAINAAGAEATSSVLAAASKKLAIGAASSRPDDGMAPMTPTYILDGDGKTVLSLYAPVHANALVAHTAASTANYLVLYVRGFHATGGVRL